jgi:hypothetical protein
VFTTWQKPAVAPPVIALAVQWWTALPPTGWVQLICASSVSGVTDVITGVSGAPGIAALLATLVSDGSASLAAPYATAVNVYEVPAVRPETSHVHAAKFAAVSAQVRAVPTAVTFTLSAALLPSYASVPETLTTPAPGPATAPVMTGMDGVPGRTTFEAVLNAESAAAPDPLALTLNEKLVGAT